MAPEPEPHDVKRVNLQLVDKPARRDPWRPTTLTKRKFLQVVHRIEQGASATAACELEAISYRNFRTRVAASLRLAQRLREAEAVRLAARHEIALASIMEAGHQSWMAHAWFLERVWPEKYSLKAVERERLTIELKTQPVRVIGLPAGLNKVYFAARYDTEAARCLKSNGLPVPKLRLKKTDKSDA
jgi:hypothetical protein